MILEEKREYILNKLNKVGILRVKDLSKELGCTEASVRYIINNLAEKKLLKRVHGGAIRDEKVIGDESESILRTKNIDEKEYITDIAVRYISDKSTIILDSGTTNFILAKKIGNFKNLNIITNSIKIANLLVRNPNLNTIILGGICINRPLAYSIVNYGNESNLMGLKADILFLNVAAVSIENGLTDPNLQESRVKRDMIKASGKIILLADSTKFNKVALSLVCPFNKVDKIITDNKIDNEFIEMAKEAGMEILY